MVYFGRAAVFSKSVLPRPLAAFGSVHRPGRRFVCELGDRIPDPAPDRYAVVIVGGCQLIGARFAFLEVESEPQAVRSGRNAHTRSCRSLRPPAISSTFPGPRATDPRAYNDVLVGPRRVFGGVAGAIALVSRVRPLAGHAPVPGRWILRQADDRARLFGGFHLGYLDAHDALIQDAGNQIRE